MASPIRRLLEGRNDTIDYAAILERFPWIVEENKNCILSPDSDGLLCGLFMSKYLNWKIVGFYDTKVLLLKDGVSCYDANTIFLDAEIYRPAVKSIGQHMLLFNKRRVPDNWSNFDSCLQPTLLRNYDKQKDFRLKYPLATIHFIMAIVSQRIEFDIPMSAIAPLFFTDGTFQVLYTYPENVINWLDYLRINDEDNILRKIFMHEHYTVYAQIKAMIDFFILRDEISISGERGDKFVISNDDNDFHNIMAQQNGKYKIEDSAKEKVEKFIALLSETTRWEYKEADWSFENLNRFKFSKSIIAKEKLETNNADFRNVMDQNPLSWALTGRRKIEYTLETPDQII